MSFYVTTGPYVEFYYNYRLYSDYFNLFLQIIEG